MVGVLEMKPTTLKDPEAVAIIRKQRRIEVEIAEIALKYTRLKLGR